MPHIRQALAKYYHNYPQEKVYLLFDKQSYYSSETVWFSGYVTYQSKPTLLSNIVYAELFSDKGLVIKRAMLPVNKGVVSGEFVLPANLPAGNYYVRAYTAWMLNFNSSLFFYQKISVKDRGKADRKVTGSSHADFSVQFFPESGNMINRLTSLIAFKAADTNGLPVNISGKIFNNLGDTIASIKTIHGGMGSFVIHCTPQTNYTALVTANGITKKIALPNVQASGIVLHTETHNYNTGDSVFFHISRSGVNKEKFENLILCAQMENHFSVTKVHFAESTFNDPFDTSLTAPYPLLLNNFGSGVLQLSVLNEDGNTLAERLVFLHGKKTGTPELKPSAISSNNKKEFSIALPDDYKGTIAVAATDADNEATSNNSSYIRSAILLSAEVDKPIYEPEWYFDENREAANGLDVLLLTCKSTKPRLQSLLNNYEERIKYLPEKSISLKGRAFEMNGEKRTPLANGSLFLILKAAADSISMPLNVNTDSAGFFILNDLNFRDTATLYVQTGTKLQGHTNNNIALEFYKNVFDSIARNNYVIAPTVLNTKFYSMNVDSIYLNNISGNNGKMLQNVTVTAKTKTHLDSVLARYASGVFANPGVWAQTMDLTNDPITINSDQGVLEWLNGKAPGLNYSYEHGKPIIYWRFSNIIAGLSAIEQLKLNAPAFFLNENLLSSGPDGYDGAIDLLSGIRMADVALIRIFKPGTLPNVPDNGPHGAVAIYLKNGKEIEKPVTKINFEKLYKTGYKINNEFKHMPNSATLYWNPSLNVNPLTHEVTFSFENSGAKRIRIIVEGMDENGQIISISQVVNNNQ